MQRHRGPLNSHPPSSTQVAPMRPESFLLHPIGATSCRVASPYASAGCPSSRSLRSKRPARIIVEVPLPKPRQLVEPTHNTNHWRNSTINAHPTTSQPSPTPTLIIIRSTRHPILLTTQITALPALPSPSPPATTTSSTTTITATATPTRSAPLNLISPTARLSQMHIQRPLSSRACAQLTRVHAVASPHATPQPHSLPGALHFILFHAEQSAKAAKQLCWRVYTASQRRREAREREEEKAHRERVCALVWGVREEVVRRGGLPFGSGLLVGKGEGEGGEFGGGAGNGGALVREREGCGGTVGAWEGRNGEVVRVDREGGEGGDEWVDVELGGEPGEKERPPGVVERVSGRVVRWREEMVKGAAVVGERVRERWAGFWREENGPLRWAWGLIVLLVVAVLVVLGLLVAVGGVAV